MCVVIETASTGGGTGSGPAATGPARLVIRNVSLEVAGEHGPTSIIKEIDITVKAGEFIALVGPSGCGKSTLLNVISGLMAPTHGTVTLDGEQGADRLGRVAHMHQRDLLLPWRTVLGNARLGLELRRVDRREADRLATELAARFGLADDLEKYPWQLSGGMRQRAALLRVSLPQSGLLLLDEPFGALDAITRSELQRWLSDVLDRTDRAIVLVTHDVEEALLLADRVLVMSPAPGRIVATETVDLSRPRAATITTTPEFVALKARLLKLLAGELEGAGK